MNKQGGGDFGVTGPRNSERARVFLPLVLLFLMTGCHRFDPTPTLIATLTPSVIPIAPIPTFTPLPTPSATATLTPTPTPSPTPIPPINLSIELRKPVTALEPVTWEVFIQEPPGIKADVRLSARVIDAQDQLYATFEMKPKGRPGVWEPVGALQLPLEPEPYPGVWHLIIDAEANLPISGYRDRVFTPQRVPYRPITDTLPVGLVFRVPQAFAEVAAKGDQIAGLRIWRYQDCEVNLAWAPGPTEPLLSDNAWVMVEATHQEVDPQVEISVEASEETVWGENEWTAFLFHERWKGTGRIAPAETLVLQGPDYRLYALRIRAQEREEIDSLCRDVRATFGFVGD